MKTINAVEIPKTFAELRRQPIQLHFLAASITVL
jgi:hypothetical protein